MSGPPACLWCDARVVPANEPLLSVRGDASRFVDPDAGELSAGVELTRDTARDAVEAVATAIESVRRQLALFGGAVREASTLQDPLTWSTRRVSSSPEWDHAQGGQTGRTVASASLSIHLRDFDLLARVEELSTSVPGFGFSSAAWTVDPDNPQWRAVRQEAVHEALRRARDYAEALGTTVLSVEHVADVGLLSAQPEQRMYAAARSFDSGGSEATLDPVPQQLTATIEARFRVAPVALGS